LSPLLDPITWYIRDTEVRRMNEKLIANSKDNRNITLNWKFNKCCLTYSEREIKEKQNI